MKRIPLRRGGRRSVPLKWRGSRGNLLEIRGGRRHRLKVGGGGEGGLCAPVKDLKLASDWSGEWR